MTEKEIFEHLFTIVAASDDVGGAVSACLVRSGQVIASGISTRSGVHGEYALLRNLERTGGRIEPGDVVYTMVEPCGRRSPSGPGEALGDCTTHLIIAGVKRIVFGALDPDASASTRHRFDDAGIILQQVTDRDIVQKCIELFNATCMDIAKQLPLQDSVD